MERERERGEGSNNWKARSYFSFSFHSNILFFIIVGASSHHSWVFFWVFFVLHLSLVVLPSSSLSSAKAYVSSTTFIEGSGGFNLYFCWLCFILQLGFGRLQFVAFIFIYVVSHPWCWTLKEVAISDFEQHVCHINEAISFGTPFEQGLMATFLIQTWQGIEAQ